MVEYAILVAGSSLRAFAADVSRLAAGTKWTYLGYAAVLLLALRIAFWVTRPTR